MHLWVDFWVFCLTSLMVSQAVEYILFFLKISNKSIFLWSKNYDNMTFFDLRTVDERWWAKYFQQSAQSNFIHKFLRQGKLQLTLGPGGSVAQNQSENIWQSRKQKLVLRHLDLQKPPSWDKTLKSGGNWKLRLGLDPSTTLAEMGSKSLGQSQVF